MKTVKKIIRAILVSLFVFICLLTFLFALSIEPLDREVNRSKMIDSMHKSIDSLDSPARGRKGFSVGYATVNLTPPYRTSTAGYGKRMGRLYTSIHDSIYVRSMVVDNGTQQVAVVSADLLIIPPEVTLLLEKQLPEIGFSINNTYLGATHSHNSMGNWSRGPMSFIYGSYDDSIVHYIADKIKQSIQLARMRKLDAVIKSASIPVANAVYNRLIDDGPVDSLLRVIEVRRSDSTRLLIMNFTAHATCIFSRDVVLSRDYPGQLVDLAEDKGYDFAMFMAGAVGSHSGRVAAKGWACVDDMATIIFNTFNEHHSALEQIDDSTVWMKRIPLLLNEPQVKVLKVWRLRPWLFEATFGNYPEHLTALRIGNIQLIGTPCDFSGEFYSTLDSLSTQYGLRTMVTSFNGGYVGYLTPNKYYDEEHYETQLMNWYGPGNGEYVEKCIEMLIEHAAGDRASHP